MQKIVLKRIFFHALISKDIIGATRKSIKRVGITKILVIMNTQLAKIEKFVESLCDERLNEEQQSLVLVSPNNFVGGDNGNACQNYAEAACSGTNRRCTNYGVCGTSDNKGNCINKDRGEESENPEI